MVRPFFVCLVRGPPLDRAARVVQGRPTARSTGGLPSGPRGGPGAVRTARSTPPHGVVSLSGPPLGRGPARLAAQGRSTPLGAVVSTDRCLHEHGRPESGVRTARVQAPRLTGPRAGRAGGPRGAFTRDMGRPSSGRSGWIGAMTGAPLPPPPSPAPQGQVPTGGVARPAGTSAFLHAVLSLPAALVLWIVGLLLARVAHAAGGWDAGWFVASLTSMSVAAAVLSILVALIVGVIARLMGQATHVPNLRMIALRVVLIPVGVGLCMATLDAVLRALD